jgi:membrane-bound lytic murein transglycosylase D
MDHTSTASAKSRYSRLVIKVVAIFAMLFFPLASKSQVSGNFFFSLLDSLEASPLLDWVQFDEKSLKSAKSYHIQKKAPSKALIEAGFKMPAEEDVNDFISGLVKKKKTAALLFALAKENFKVSEQKLSLEKLPQIFKYLPIALSAMDPKAEWGNGAGIWHCYFPQAVKSGLKFSEGKDERFDVSKSGDAAIKQLKSLYALNKNNVSETILMYVFGKNYHNNNSLLALGYTPESFLQAFTIMAYIMETNQIPAFSEASMVYPAISEFVTDNQVQLNFHNKKYPFNIRQLAYLNPTFVSGAIPVGSILKAPYEDALALINWLNSSEEKTVKEVIPIEHISHRIKSGENLGIIANKYNVSVSDLKNWNNLKSDLIREGQILTIYKKQ